MSSVFQKLGVIVYIYVVCFHGWLCAGQDNGQTTTCSAFASDNTTVVKMCQDSYTSGSSSVLLDSFDAGTAMPPEGAAKCSCTLTMEGDERGLFMITRQPTAEMASNCGTQFHILSDFQSESIRCSRSPLFYDSKHVGPTVTVTLSRAETAPSGGYQYGYCWNVNTRDSRSISVACTAASRPSIAPQTPQSNQNATSPSIADVTGSRPRPSNQMTFTWPFFYYSHSSTSTTLPTTWSTIWSTTWSTALRSSTKSTDVDTVSPSSTAPTISAESMKEITSSQLQESEMTQQTDSVINSTKTPVTDSTAVKTPTTTISTSTTEKTSTLALTQITTTEKSSPSIQLTSATPDFTTHYIPSTEFSVIASAGSLSSVSHGTESTGLTTYVFLRPESTEATSSVSSGSESTGLTTSALSRPSSAGSTSSASFGSSGSLESMSSSLTGSAFTGSTSFASSGSASNGSTSFTSSGSISTESTSSVPSSSPSAGSSSFSSPGSTSNGSTSVSSSWSLSVENTSSASPGSAPNGSTPVTSSWSWSVENTSSASPGSASNGSTSVTSSWSLSVENTSSASPGSAPNGSTPVTSSWSLSVENTSSASPASASNGSTSVTSSWSLSVENTSSASPGSASNGSTSVTSSWSLSVENTSITLPGSVSIGLISGSSSWSSSVENTSSTYSASAFSGSTVSPSWRPTFPEELISSTISASTFSTSISPTLEVSKMCHNSFAEGSTKVSLDIFAAALTLPLEGAAKGKCTVTIENRRHKPSLFYITSHYPSSRKKDCGTDVTVYTSIGWIDHYECVPNANAMPSLYFGNQANITLLRDAESPPGGYEYLLGFTIFSSNSKKISIACEEFSIPETKLLRGDGGIVANTDVSTKSVTPLSSSTTKAKTDAQTGNQKGNAQKETRSFPDGAVIGLCVALSVLLMVLVVIAMICLYRNMNSYRADKSTTIQPESTEKYNFLSVGGEKNTQMSDLVKPGDTSQQSFKAFKASALLNILNEQNTIDV